MNSMNIHHVTKVEQENVRHHSGAVWTKLVITYTHTGEPGAPEMTFEVALFAADTGDTGRKQPPRFISLPQRNIER